MSISVPMGLDARARAGDVPGASRGVRGVRDGPGAARGVLGVPSFEGVPVERCGVSGTITCCEDRVLRGVDASDDARDDGRLDGVDIFNFTLVF